MELIKSVILCEVGPRDGLQSEKTIVHTQEKCQLIQQSVDAGFSVIEVGSFVHPKAVPQMADTDEVFRSIRQKPGVEYRALIANLRGVERAAACGCKKVKLNVSASKAHNLANLNRTPTDRCWFSALRRRSPDQWAWDIRLHLNGIWIPLGL